jgi:hypothetical protein
MQVSRLVRENLTNRALQFNLVLDDVSITHVAFSPEFTHAVEAKQVRSRASPHLGPRLNMSFRLRNKLLFELPSLWIRPFKRSRYLSVVLLTRCHLD